MTPTIQVYLNGVRAADGSNPNEPATAPFVVEGLSISWGRDNTLDQPAGDVCSFTMARRFTASEGQLAIFNRSLKLGVRVDVDAGSGYRVFTGQVTSVALSATGALGSGWIRYDIVADDALTDLSNRPSGTDDRPVETVSQRANYVLTDRGVPITMPAATAAIRVKAYDADADSGAVATAMVARIKASTSRHETEQASRRLRGKLAERAAAGLSHSRVAYGWTRDADGTEHLDPEQSALVLEAATRALAGDSLRGLARDFNAAGRLRPNGKEWTAHLLRQVLLRPRNAGRVVHQEKVLPGVVGQWPVILDADTFDRLQALLTGPERRSNVNRTARAHLLTGIATCGVCGGRMTALVRSAAYQRKWGMPGAAYRCEDQHCVQRSKATVDALITGLVLERLTQPDALVALAGGDRDAVAAASAELEALEARRASILALVASGDFDAAEGAQMATALRQQRDAAQARLTAAMPTALPVDVAGPDAEARWMAASLDQRRAIVAALTESIVVRPTVPGKRFRPEDISVTWRA